MADDLIGKTIGGYEILDKLGQGGMASVYRARQTSMNRIVALKILPRHLSRDDTYLQRFEREVNIVSQLEHRNIVPVHDYGEHEGQPYIAMRLMEAGSVDEMLNKGLVEIDKALNILRQIAPALDYAHSKNVLHRDLKPSNILIDDDGGAYITDFGIARILGTGSSTITTQGVVGTPSYMSPEQAQGKKLDGRSDIYSLGVMLFEMLTGRRPFEADTPYGVAVKQVTTEPPSPRAINPQMSGAIEQVILKALKKKEDNRYQSAAKLVESLQAAIDNPDSMHDTEPHRLPIKEALEYARSAPPDRRSGGRLTRQQTVPSTDFVIPSNTPQQQSRPKYRATTPRSVPLIRPVQRPKRRNNNLWLSVALGGMIGCAMLSAITVIVAVIVGNLLVDSGNSPSSTITPTPPATQETDAVVANETAAISDDAQLLTTLYPGLDIESATIIYFAVREDNYDIYQYDLLSTVETRLTSDLQADSYPRISPNGTHIAFQSERDGDFEIYIMSLFDGEITQLTDNEVMDRIPSWSPDGNWIIYSSDTREDGRMDIYRVSINGGEAQIIYSDGQRNSHPRYSHDGQYVVFTSGRSGNADTWEIMILDLAAGETLQLTDNEVRDASPSFSPDDERIIYTTYGEGEASIAITNADGNGEAVILYDGPGFEWGMDYNNDGSLIIFNSQIDDVSTLHIMNSDGTDYHQIDNDGGFYPSWMD